MATYSSSFKRVKPAQGVRDLCEVAALILNSLPINAASKHAVRVVLRTAVNKSCPNYRGNNNKKNVQYVSHDAAIALNTGNGKLISDHAIPLSLMLNTVYAESIFSVEDLVELVGKYSVMTLITDEEDTRLRLEGLGKAMPADWDGESVLARYKTVGINVMPNPVFKRAPDSPPQ